MNCEFSRQREELLANIPSYQALYTEHITATPFTTHHCKSQNKTK